MDFLSKIHPLIVHFPVALLIIYSVLEIIAHFNKENKYDKFTTVFLALAVFFALAAVLTGNKAAESVQHLANAAQSGSIETHETFATITVFFYSALFFIKLYLLSKKKFTGKIKYAYLTMVLIGNIFIYLTGYYGGRLVFEYGIGTSLFK